VTIGNDLTSQAHIKEQLWTRKEKEPHPGLVVMGFWVFFSPQDAENKVLDLFGLFSRKAMESLASPRRQHLGFIF